MVRPARRRWSRPSPARCSACRASVLLGEDLWPHSAWLGRMLLALGLGVHAFGQGLSAYAMGTLGASVTSIVLVYGVAITVVGAVSSSGKSPISSS